jgi:hypothetical protein
MRGVYEVGVKLIRILLEVCNKYVRELGFMNITENSYKLVKTLYELLASSLQASYKLLTNFF